MWLIVSPIMGPRRRVLLLILHIQILVIGAVTDSHEYTALKSLKGKWQKTPPNWVGNDPCGTEWEGITCIGSSVTKIVLAGIGLKGTLPEDIQYFPQLRTLDLSQNKGLTGTLTPLIGNLTQLVDLVLTGCNFNGQIPNEIGSLTKLVTLNLNSNNFSGPIPASIGNLRDLFLLDLTDNQLDGTIPVSSETSPGLDQLTKALHFHLGRNMLSGPIPLSLFNSRMAMIHVLLDSNQLSGNIPSTLSEAKSLQVIRLDNNLLSGTVDLNFTSMPNITTIYFSNNQLTGPMPDLSGLNGIKYVEMSNNTFEESTIPSWFSSLESLTSLIMENTNLQGSIPVRLFSLPQLESIILKNNQLNGTLDIGTSIGSQLQLIDMQNNSIDVVQERGYNKKLNLVNNPICQNSNQDYCSQQPDSSYTPPPPSICKPCGSGQIASPNCSCSYPVTGILNFRSFTFSNWENPNYSEFLVRNFAEAFTNASLPVESISVSIQVPYASNYLEVKVEVFPPGQNRLSRAAFAMITSQLNNLTFVRISKLFGPFYYNATGGLYFSETNSANAGIIIGTAVGGSILFVLLIIAGVYAFRQRNNAKRATKRFIQLTNPFEFWNPDNTSASRPQISGVRCFSFEEIKKCTNNFSNTNILGSGGYGPVYKGKLETGSLVAIKRAQQGSLQGSLEFKSEIELLSRVHHRNVVKLLGFCYELGEQMLVYEYIPNSTLKDSLSGKSGIKLNWIWRLRVALDSARGLAYLHELANPSIIHRDVKSNNILLDDQLIAKVADFGLSKTLDESGKDHITTGVKGTLGYLDPEYFTTQQVTEKSDVYSFGVVMLELITARSPIERGNFIVRELDMAMDRTKALYNLHEILDPNIRLGSKLIGLEKFVDLAMICVEESGANRPAMSEVVREIENILQLALSELQ